MLPALQYKLCQRDAMGVWGVRPRIPTTDHMGFGPQGWPNPQDKALQGTTLLGVSRKTPRRYPEDTTRSIRKHMIP